MPDPKKTEPKTAPAEASHGQPVGCLGLLLRITWMGIGNVALVLLALSILEQGRFSMFDALFWSAVGALVAVRFVDITRFGGLTTENAPADLRDWRRYATLLLLAAAGIWGVAHWIGRLMA